ncbi:MAG: relaxase domain-containing protein [Flavipsychrobacter sp.]|nr:relaxase domain-containing protein [Flavipsychrobacter sp.]
MLGITKSPPPVALTNYLVNNLQKDDYYFSGEPVTAIWAGKAAKHLGLSGEVNKKDFSSVAKGIHPVTGKSFILRDDDKRRTGQEFCFSAPKSTSLIYAITKDQEILSAHRAGVAAAMSAIEEDMHTKNRVSGHIEYERTGNLVYASFDHFTTRPNKEILDGKKIYVPDCQLHSHAVVFNVTYSPLRQRLQSIETFHIHSQANYYEAIYHATFSRILAEKGYPIQRTAERWEIAGVSRTVIEKFSRRTQHIEQVAREKGITNAKIKGELGAKTRVNKNKSVAEKDLYHLWEQRLTAKELFQLRSVKGTANLQIAQTITPEEAIERSLNNFLERKSVVAEKRVMGDALALGYGILLPEQVKKAMAERSDILSATQQTIKYITTKQSVRLEDKLLEIAVEGKGTLPPLHPNYSIRQEFLSEEQKEAVQTLLNSRDFVTVLEGAAGTGKSSLLSEIQFAANQAGKEIVATAPSANASRSVLREKGFSDSDTIATLLQNTDLQEKLKNNILVLDEASLVGNKTMLEVLKLAKEKNARVILSGDAKQHASVEAGDALRLLQERGQLKTATVRTVIRQQKNHAYRDAIQSLAVGQTLKAFNQLDRMNAVVEIEDTEKRETRIASDYVTSLRSGRSASVVAPTHAEGRSITDAIRQKLKKEKIITGKERSFETLRSLSMTEVQKQDIAQYETGMQIRFHQNIPGGFKAGQNFKIIKDEKTGQCKLHSDADNKAYPLPVEHAAKFEVFREQQTKIAKGDLIGIRVNGKTIEGSRIHNQQTYTVRGFTKNGDIQLSNGKTLDRNFRHFSHAHVITSYASQGKDVDDVFLAQGSLSIPGTNMQQFYVAASRGRERCTIYCDDKAELKKAIMRSADRMTAKEVADQHHHRVSRANRLKYYLQEIKRNYEKTISREPEPGISRQGRSIERE